VNSREERERLKQEYKEHYRSILESRKKLEQYERKAKIMKALEQIDPTPVLDGLHNALGKLREKVTLAESRLETYMDDADAQKAQAIEEAETFSREQRAKDSLKSIRMEMGSLEEEVERKVSEISAEKTIQPVDDEKESSGHARISSDVVKTIGKKKES